MEVLKFPVIKPSPTTLKAFPGAVVATPILSVEYIREVTVAYWELKLTMVLEAPLAWKAPLTYKVVVVAFVPV